MAFWLRQASHRGHTSCESNTIWLAHRIHPSPRLHRLRNEKCQSRHHCHRLPQRLIILFSSPSSPTSSLFTAANVRAFVLCSLFSSFTDGPALLLCFKLHESRTAVVSSTAAATLRQLVMFIVDKVVEEDCRMLLANELESMTLPDGTTQARGHRRARRVCYLRGSLSVG
ncbi:hypothetical protein F5888DRAFT_515535 [Russula emetica]|nr:hypothetical protein F5888DRAFT_515535 [Russula emetica]